MCLFSDPRWYFYVARPRWATRVFIKRRLKPFLPTCDQCKVLDLGCGPGSNTFLFPRQSYLGIDIDYARIKFAQSRYPAHLGCVGTATGIPLAGDSVDGILACGLLHHLSDATAQRVLHECSRLLRKRGRLLLIEPALSTRGSLLDYAMVKIDLGDYLRTVAALRCMLARQFQVQHLELFFLPPAQRCVFIVATGKR